MPSPIHHTLNLLSPPGPCDEGRAVVHPDDVGQPLAAEQGAERRLGPSRARLRQYFDFQDETAEQIRHGHRIATLAVAGFKPAFEIHAQHVVATFRGRQSTALGLEDRAAPAAFGHHPVALEHLSHRADDRRILQAVLGFEHPPDLFRPPGRVQAFLRHDEPLDRSGGPAGHAQRRTAPLLERLDASLWCRPCSSLQMKVGSLPADHSRDFSSSPFEM